MGVLQAEQGAPREAAAGPKDNLDLKAAQKILEDLIVRVEELAASFEGRGVQMETKVIGDRPSGAIPREHPLVQLAKRALEEAGITPALEASSTDANIPLSRGRPCICVGLAQGAHAHRPDEYIETRDVKKGLGVLVKIVRSAFMMREA